MKRLVLALALLWALPANAQNMLLLGSGRAQTKVAAAASGYTGPGDVVTGAYAWWGLRCYNAAYTGNVADVYAPADASHTLITCSTGGVLNETLQALSVTCAVSCTVKTLYDQSGNSNCTTACDLFNSTGANRPTLTLNCFGSLPCMTWNGSSTVLTPTFTSAAIAQPYTLNGVMNVTSLAANTFFLAINNAATGPFFGFKSSKFDIESGGTLFNTVAATTATNYAVQAIFNGASSVLYINGSSNSGNAGTQGAPSTATIRLGDDGFSEFFNGISTEAGVWGSSFDATQQANMNSNQRAYWGF